MRASDEGRCQLGDVQQNRLKVRKIHLEKIKISGSIIPNTFQAWPQPISGSGRNEIITGAEYNRGKWAHDMFSMTRSIFHIFAYCFHHFYAPFEAETSNIFETKHLLQDVDIFVFKLEPRTKTVPVKQLR